MNFFHELIRGMDAPPPSRRDEQQRIRHLERQVEQLTVACAAMWNLVRGHMGMTQEDLVARMREIDLMAVGREAVVCHPGDVICPSCGRDSQSPRSWCLHCGAELGAGSAIHA